MREERTRALVTGGARRLGRAIALDLAANGFDIVLHCKGSRKAAEELAAELDTLGAETAVLEADLCDRLACGELMARAQDALGPVRLLVNNASAFEDDSVEEPDWEKWERHFCMHLQAPVELTRRMAGLLPDGQDGLVVNMIDQRVWKLTPRYFSYTLSKSALWTATQTMAQALAPRVRVNAIGPGPAMRNRRQSQQDFDKQAKAVPLQRGPDPKEFGRTIRYLWEARSITGQMIALDGGQHLAWQTPDVTDASE